MKTTNNNPDVLAEARKSSSFRRFSRDADVRIRPASDVYDFRKKKGLSQSELAKKIHSTQKIVSRIESGDTNIGIELLNRIVEELEFNSENLCRIFNCGMVISFKSKSKHNAISNEMVANNSFMNILSYNTH